MISIVNTDTVALSGLSTDTKPTENIGNGSSFLEIDTSKLYLFNAETKTWKVTVSYPKATKEITEIGTKEITHSGEYIAADDNLDGYSKVTVSYPKVTKEITENGTYSATDEGLDGYTSVKVNLPLGEKEITENGTYSATDDNLKGYTSVEVNLPLGEKKITENGTYSATDEGLDGYTSVKVDVPTATGGTLLKDFLTVRECRNLFENSTLSRVDNIISFYDTSDVTDMSNMFYNCGKLTSVPAMDTSKVTNMIGMFSYCSNLTSVPAMDTSNVTNMINMFYYCGKLTSVPAMDTSKVTNMINMFEGCSKLTSILMYGMKVSFNIRNTALKHDALVVLLNNLGRPTSTQTLTMGSRKLALLSDAEKKIATDKNWTLA